MNVHVVVACTFCGYPVDPGDSTTYQLHVGWARPRRKGEHGLTLPVRQNTFACLSCIEHQKRGISPNQGALGL